MRLNRKKKKEKQQRKEIFYLFNGLRGIMDGRLNGSEWTFWRASGDEKEKHSLPNYSLKCDWMRRKYWGMSLKGEKGKSMLTDTCFHLQQPAGKHDHLEKQYAMKSDKLSLLLTHATSFLFPSVESHFQLCCLCFRLLFFSSRLFIINTIKFFWLPLRLCMLQNKGKPSSVEHAPYQFLSQHFHFSLIQHEEVKWKVAGPDGEA